MLPWVYVLHLVLPSSFNLPSPPTLTLLHRQGRVAEELQYGKDNVTDGASSDISNATSIASSMVRRFGFSDALGPVAHPGGDNEPPSQETQKLIDSEIKGLLEAAQDRARAVLKSRKHELERLAKALVEYETLDAAETQKGSLAFSSFSVFPDRVLTFISFDSHQGRED
jgi:hypothetical protein